MTNVHRKLSERFRSQWVKVKFFNNEPVLSGVKRLKDVRFCEATKEAMSNPVILDRGSVSCPGARHAFGWENNSEKEFLNRCRVKSNFKEAILRSTFSRSPRFKIPFKYIGLNIEGEPDIVMSYMAPSDVMNFIKVFNEKFGRDLKCSLRSMMSICGGIAVETYLNKNVSISFGCDDSRKFANMKRDNLAVGIPNKLFKAFAG
jgi:uncharacterized protein (DUF169 family)